MRKIVFIGAGSFTFTRNLVRDLLTFPALADSTIALVDLDADRLAFARAAVDRIIRTGRYPARVEAYTERSSALPGADGAVSTILVGGLDVWRTDIEIPKRYHGQRRLVATVQTPILGPRHVTGKISSLRGSCGNAM